MNDVQFLAAAYNQFRIQAEGMLEIQFIVISQHVSDTECRDILYESLSIPLPDDSARYIVWPTLPFSLRAFETIGDATDAALNQIDEWRELIRCTFEAHGVAEWEVAITISTHFEDVVREAIDNFNFYRVVLRAPQMYPTEFPDQIDLFTQFEDYVWDFAATDCRIARVHNLNYDHALWAEILDREHRAQAAIILQNFARTMTIFQCTD